MIQLHEGEKLVKTIRRHWFVVALDVLIFLILAIVPLFIITVVLNQGIRGAEISYGPIIAFFYSVWLLFTWNIFAVAWTNNYYLDVILITNRRLLKIDQISLFARDISEMRLERVQDINVETMGIIPSLLNFGDLKVQTAGEEKEFVMHNIPNPNEIKNIIFKYHDSIDKRNI